jgi:His/Glu/Gln/Arg/opine family amino acid ABC transporter permease subunit
VVRSRHQPGSVLAATGRHVGSAGFRSGPVYVIDFGRLAPYIGLFVDGFRLTLELSVAALAISMPLGLGGALLRTSQSRVLRNSMAAYVQIFRNVPLLVVVYIVFYELPVLGIQIDSFMSGLLAITMNSTAYLIEIFRGGLAAIPRGQYDAANALGMRAHQIFLYVVLPQLVRVAFPALGNQVVGVILGSSLVMVVGVRELTLTSYIVGAETYRYFEVFVIAAIFYMVAVQLVNRFWIFAGRRWFSVSAVGPSL